ncbi:Capsular polysaccharide biosynthsis protein [Clostridium bornimense]|uniref:non-specific protein-tyrosine kinase n=1 Tax=Clostridium bornimense TaxID=1216932 RepID=W6S4G8_9CLOT|nr:polysaccharide biosynthesis tyrosine autokinase [Clostridium bornimense]CDM69237.1 Capsular polysaccharide biosynthsis protein [Clostridium bornimense]
MEEVKVVEEFSNEISFSQIIFALKKRWKIIFATTIFFTALVALITFFFIDPVYEVHTKVFIGKDAEVNYDNNDVQMYQKLLLTYAQILKTEDLIGTALNNVDSDMTMEEVMKDITVEPITDTQILQIKLTGKNKDDLAVVLESITEEFIKESKEIVPNGNVKIIRHVKEAEAPISPNKKMNIILGFLIGLVSGMAIVFLIEYMNNTYKSKEEVERNLKLPVLGVIPKFGRKREKLVMEEEPRSLEAECYRTMVTNIQYSSIDSRCKTIVVTSSQKGEGKTTISGNLALSLAGWGNRVVLIDCDIRRAALHKAFNISNSKGLTDVLVNQASLKDVAVGIKETLLLIPAGRVSPNPTELLNSKAMELLLEELKETCDYVILDTAPVEAVADAQILSAKADGTLVVIKSGDTRINVIQDALNLLNKVRGKILGVVLNATEDGRLSKMYQYYGEEHKKKGDKVS